MTLAALAGSFVVIELTLLVTCRGSPLAKVGGWFVLTVAIPAAAVSALLILFGGTWGEWMGPALFLSAPVFAGLALWGSERVADIVNKDGRRRREVRREVKRLMAQMKQPRYEDDVE